MIEMAARGLTVLTVPQGKLFGTAGQRRRALSRIEFAGALKRIIGVAGVADDAATTANLAGAGGDQATMPDDLKKEGNRCSAW